MSVVGLRREVVALVGGENAASGGAGEMGAEHERIRRGRRCKQCAPCLRGPRRDRRPRAPSTPNDGIGSGGAARTKSGMSHASAATSSGVASAEKSMGKGMTSSTTRVIRTPPTSHDIVPTLQASFGVRPRINR